MREARILLCLLFIALLVTPKSTLGAYRARGWKGVGVLQQRKSTSDDTRVVVDAVVVPRLLSLRGGGDIHFAEVDIGHGNKVVVRSYRDGNSVTSSFTSSCGGFDVQWGVAIGQMDSWSNPKTVQSGKYTALIPPGSRDHMGTAMRTPLGANSPILIGTKGLGAQDDQLWGLRYVIVESASGKLYPTGGMTLFTPLKEGVDTSYVIKPDYGSLEERLAKRQNLPLELEGDHGRDSITVGNSHDGGADRNHMEALHVQPAHIDRDVGSVLHHASERILGWVNTDQSRKLGGKGGGGGGLEAAVERRQQAQQAIKWCRMGTSFCVTRLSRLIARVERQPRLAWWPSAHKKPRARTRLTSQCVYSQRRRAAASSSRSLCIGEPESTRQPNGHAQPTKFFPPNLKDTKTQCRPTSSPRKAG